MISVQDTLMSSYFSTMELNSSGHKMPVENFLKEALQILIQASHTVNPTNSQYGDKSIKNEADNATDAHLQNTNNNNNNKQKNKQKSKLTKSNANNKMNDNNNDNNTITTISHGGEDTDDTEKGTTSWLLNVTSNSPWITVETDIQTIAGLEEVLEYICTYGIQPPKTTHRFSAASVCSDQYQMTSFIHALSETLRLSQVMVIPKIDVFAQYNSVQIMKQCVQVFIMCDGALFMDVQRLVTMTDTLLSSSPSIFHHYHDYPIDTLLLFSICSMMIRHVMVHRHGNASVAAGLARAYYKKAESILQDVFDIPHIAVLQSIFMLSLYPHGHVDFFSLSRCSSNKLKDAIRLALAMRLHQLDLPQNNDNNNINNDPHSHYQMDIVDRQKEYKRRLAWMIICADHASDVNQTGNAGLIDVNQWHVNFPQPLPGEKTTRRVEFFSHYCQIMMIRKMQLFRSAYMVVSQSPEALASAMDEKLFNTYYKSTLKQHLHTPFDLDHYHFQQEDQQQQRWQWTKEDMEPLLLEGLYCNTSIMALVPFLPRRYFDTFENGNLLRDSGIQDVYQLMKRQESVSEVIVLPLPPSPFSSSSSTSSSSSSQQQQNNNNDNNNNKKKSNHLHNENNNDYNFKHLDEIEMHTVIRCLKAANKYIYVLEKLNEIDPIHCYHNTTYGSLLMFYVYDMIQTNCQQYDVAFLCKLNLIRLLRVIKHTQKFDPDPTFIYLERMVNGCCNTSGNPSLASLATEDSSSLERKTASLLTNLKHMFIDSASSSTSSDPSTTILDNTNLIM